MQQLTGSSSRTGGRVAAAAVRRRRGGAGGVRQQLQLRHVVLHLLLPAGLQHGVCHGIAFDICRARIRPRIVRNGLALRPGPLVRRVGAVRSCPTRPPNGTAFIFRRLLTRSWRSHALRAWVPGISDGVVVVAYAPCARHEGCFCANKLYTCYK